MSKIFVSHSSLDNVAAQAIGDWLRENGFGEFFLDLDPDRGIHPGERWEKALYAAANRCEAVIFLISRNWLASDWCEREFSLARILNKNLFSVVIDHGLAIGDLKPQFREAWQVVNLADGQDGAIREATLLGTTVSGHVTWSQTGLRRLKNGLDKAGLDAKYFRWPPEDDPRRAPYRGLLALEEKDAAIFFGREADIVQGGDRLRKLRDGAPPRILVFLGASGAGKSSYLRAGLLARLRRDDANFLPLAAIRPGRDALTGEDGLLAALVQALPKRPRAELRAALAQAAEGVRQLLADLAEEARASAGAEKPPAILIAVDQAEELFRAEGARESGELLALLRALVEADDPVCIALFAIRSDSYDRLEQARELAGLAQEARPLLPLPRGNYERVIEGPAQRAAEAGEKLAIDPKLTARLLADIDREAGADALPLLAFTLQQLYEDHHASGRLTVQDYEAFGAMGGAIDRAVERAFRKADADPSRFPGDRAQREALLRRGLVPWLAGIDPDTRSPRRNIARASEIPEEARPMIGLLVEERLLVADRRPDGAGGFVDTLEPAHEALLRRWGLLKGWLEADLGLLATLEALRRAVRDWDANARAEAWLAHGGERLAAAQALDARPDIAARLDATDRAYLLQCRRREDAARAETERRRQEREQEQARRQSDARRLAQRTRIGIAVAAVLALTAAAFGWFAWRESTVALENSRQAAAERERAEAAKQDAVTARQDATAQHAAADKEHSAAEAAREQAEQRARDARSYLTGALAALSKAVVSENPAKAAKLALAAWPRNLEDRASPKLGVTLSALGAAVSDLRERRDLKGHDNFIRGAAFSPDGARVVTASDDKTARLWDAATGRPIVVLKGHDGIVNEAAFSPDGTRIVTASSDNTARLWDASTGRPVAVLRGHVNYVNHAAFSPDNTRIVTASEDSTARLWDATNGEPIAVLKGHDRGVTTAAFSPDGVRIVTASVDHTARLWDAASGKPIAVFTGHTDAVNSAAFSPDGARIVTASVDRTARLWDAATGKPIAVFKGHIDNVKYAAFSPDGARVVTASHDGTARLWAAPTGTLIAVLRGHDSIMNSVAFSPDGARVVTASADKTARLWDVAIGEPITVLKGHNGVVWSAAFSPDAARVVTASSDRTARLWDAATGKSVAVFSGHTDGVNSAAFSPDGARVVTASDDRTARLWDAATGKPTAVFSGHTDSVNSAAFSPDGVRIVTASNDSTARLWDAATGKPIIVLKNHNGAVNFAAFSPDGTRVVTASADSTARLWDAATGQTIVVLNGHDDSVNYAAFSPNGARVVTTSDDFTARLWDSATGKPIAVLKGHDEVVWSAAFSPDGSRIVTASFDNTAELWDASTGKPIAVLAHDAAVTSAAFSLDGARIVTASRDRTARLWDAATGVTIAVLKRHDDSVNAAAFSPDGARIVTASDDGTARIWDARTPKGDIFHIACAWLPDTDLSNIAHDYGLTDLAPICQGDPPLPDPPPP